MLSLEVLLTALGLGQLRVLGRIRHEQMEPRRAARGSRPDRFEQCRGRGGLAGDDENVGRRLRRRSGDRRPGDVALGDAQEGDDDEDRGEEREACHRRPDPEPAAVTRLREQIPGGRPERPRQDVGHPEREHRIQVQRVVQHGNERDRTGEDGE